MPDNVETFTFDTSSAVASLRQLDKAVDGVNGSVERLNATAAATNKLSNPYKGQTKSVQNYQKEAAKSLKNIENRLAVQRNSVQKLGFSWRAVGKLIAGDLIRRGVFTVAQAFLEAADAAAEFQLQIARIVAITDNLSFGQIEQQILDLSTALARPVEEVGGALFEAFQNELGTTAETLELVSGAANDLALITGGNLTQAVNAISSAVKGYNLDIDEAKETSALFFNAIDNGRVTLDELESSLGKVAGLGRAAGVGLDNVLAAVSTITLAGTDANVAFTQLRNVLNKAVKPTKELRGALNQLGATSFDDLVNRLSDGNLATALQKIFDTLGQDPERFAKAFNTIRGQLGAINILLKDEGTSEFNRILAEGEESAKKFAEGLEEIRATDAFAAQQNAAEFNKILTELGKTALSIKVAAGDVFLLFISNAAEAKAALVGVGLAMATYIASLKIAALAAVGAFPLAAMVAFGAALGIVVSKGIDVVRAKLDGTADSVQRLAVLGQDLTLIEERHQKEIDDLNDSLGNVEDNILGISEAGRDAFRTITFEADLAGQAISDIMADATAQAGKGMKDLLSTLEKEIGNIEKRFQDANQAFTDSSQKLADFDFERGLRGLSDLDKLTKLTTKATEDLSKARRVSAQVQTGKATKEEEDAAFKIAEQSARARTSLADKVGLQNQITDALNEEREVLRDVANIDKQRRNTLNETRGENLRDDYLAASELGQEIKSVQEQINDLISNVDDQGQLQSREQQRKDLEEAERLQKRLNDLSSEFQALEVFGQTDLDQQAAAVVDTFEKAVSEAVFDWTANLDGLQEQLNNREAFKAEIEFVEAADAAASGELQRRIDEARAGAGGSPAERAGATNQAVNQVIREQELLGQTIEANTKKAEIFAESIVGGLNLTGTKGFVETISEFFTGGLAEKTLGQTISASFGEIATQISTTTAEGFEGLRQQTSEQIVGISEAVKAGLLTPEQGEELKAIGRDIFGALGNQAELFEAKQKINPELLQDAQEFKEEFKEVENIEITPKVDQKPTKELAQSTKLVAAAAKVAAENTEAVGPAATRAEGGMSVLNSTTEQLALSAGSVVTQIDTIIDRLNQAISLQNQLDSGNTDANVFRGGQVNYRANGGTGRGQDTIPARLAPEEFVVNSRSSRNFFSELQSINAGSSSATSSGGSTTNINVGDINVSSNSQLPNQTARDVGQSIQREIRRRTFKL